jgi:TonB family protein
MFDRFARILALLVWSALAAPAALAQQPAANPSDDANARPIFVTMRIFQLKAKRGSHEEPTSQVFKMKTAGLDQHDKWLRALSKTYPGLEVSLLRTSTHRVFRTSKPTSTTIAKHAGGRSIEMQMYGAHSPGETENSPPGTSLIPEVSLQFGANGGKPTALAIQPLEVESGHSYFFAPSGLKFTPNEFVSFMRPNAPASQFEGQDLYLALAFSVDLDRTTTPPRFYDERQSYELQEKATKKVQPDVPAALRPAGLSGAVRIQIEIAPDGKVSTANVYSSNFPEMNIEAMNAARQWEFPPALFAETKTPITCFLTFILPDPAKKASPANNSNQ